MSSTPTTKTMRLAGGNPSLDFVNTIDARFAGPDLLLTYLALLNWGSASVCSSEEKSQNSTPPEHG